MFVLFDNHPINPPYLVCDDIKYFISQDEQFDK